MKAASSVARVSACFVAVASVTFLVVGEASGGETIAAESAWAFRTPGQAVYCQLEAARSLATNSLLCITPNDGFWTRIRATRSGRVRISKGYSRRWRGYRHPSAPVLRFGGDWLSSDAALFICESRSNGLTCRHYDGLTFWLGRYHGYRIYRGRPGLAPQVEPLFRTEDGVWCGLATGGGSDPANALLHCWRVSDGKTFSLLHSWQTADGVIDRNARAHGYRPRGFPLLRRGGTFAWRCRDVNPEWVDRCSANGPGSAVFTCGATPGRLRCTNRFARGFDVVSTVASSGVRDNAKRTLVVNFGPSSRQVSLAGVVLMRRGRGLGGIAAPLIRAYGRPDRCSVGFGSRATAEWKKWRFAVDYVEMAPETRCAGAGRFERFFNTQELTAGALATGGRRGRLWGRCGSA